MRAALFPSLVADNLEHGLGGRGLFEGLAEIGAVKELGNIGEGMEVLLELALRHEKKHHEIHRLIIQRIEIDAFAGAAESADDLVDQVGRGVWDANTKADPGAHGGFALLDNGGNGVLVLGFNLASGDEIVDELIDCLPPIGGPQISQDLLFAQDIA